MAPPNGIEKRLKDALATALSAIGQAPTTDWLTSPVSPVADGTPNDAVANSTNPQLFIQFYRTDPAAEGAGMSLHRYQVTFIVWMVGLNTDVLFALKADVLRAIFRAEGTVTSQFNQHFWPDAFQYHTEMRAAGNMVGSLIVTIEVEVDHNSP